jgi:hypothetical protein
VLLFAMADEKEKTETASDDDALSSSSDSFPISLPKKKPRVEVPFSLADLEAEIESLRTDPPPYVSRVGHLTRPKKVCYSSGQVGSPRGTGPWDLTVCVSGEDGDEAYGHLFRLSLRFHPAMWPMKLAIVRFQCVFHHALTEEGGGMLAPFYKALPRDDRDACTVRLVLQHVRTFLTDPLSSWNISKTQFSDGGDVRINLLLREHRLLNKERFEIIKKYSQKVLHPDLFAQPSMWHDEWLDPSFRQAREEGTMEAWRSILKEHLPGEVFSFKMLTTEFCDKFTEEIFNFYSSGLPARRPNSMNAYGIILNEIGLEPLIDELQRILQPIGEMLWPGPGSVWDGHHCFIVRYRAGEDLGLDMHTDDSDVTFNICLGLDFTGAGLQFCGQLGAPNHRKHTFTYQHVRGSCVCHLGRKRHGADDISSGERLNLILWNHSSTYRQSDDYIKPPYSTEVGPPDAVCVSYTHDRDYGNFKEYPPGKENFKGRGWCPRPKKEYEGFKPDCDKEVTGS